MEGDKNHEEGSTGQNIRETSCEDVSEVKDGGKQLESAPEPEVCESVKEKAQGNASTEDVRKTRLDRLRELRLRRVSNGILRVQSNLPYLAVWDQG